MESMPRDNLRNEVDIDMADRQASLVEGRSAPEAAAAQWLDVEAGEVRQAAIAALAAHAQSAAHHQLLEALLLDAVDRLDVCRLAARLPLLVAFGIRGEVSPDARRLAAALMILEAGIYTLDHIMDREVEGPVAALPPGQALLGAVSMISHIPYQVLSDAADIGATAAVLMARLADGLARIAAGQLADIAASPANGADSRSIEEAVRMKTGERRALYAALAAHRSGAEEGRVEAYAAYGRSLGTARQLRSDLLDLFGARPSRDLSNGTTTFPIALLLEKASGPLREEIGNLLLQARQDGGAHERIREHLRRLGILRDVVAVIQTNCRHALVLIDRLRPHDRAALLLRGFVRQVSVLAP